MRTSTLTRSAVLVAVAGVAVSGLAACSSSDSGSDNTPVPVNPASSSATSTEKPNNICNVTTLAQAIPEGASVTRYACGSTGEFEIAAIQANPGKTVFWVRRSGDQWVSDQGLSSQICGGASAGYSAEILSFCLPTPKEPQ